MKLRGPCRNAEDSTRRKVPTDRMRLDAADQPIAVNSMEETGRDNPLHPSTNESICISTWAFSNQYIQQPPPHYQEHNSDRVHTSTMCDSSTLARFILASIVRPLVFVILAFIGVLATYVLYILMRRRILAYQSPLRNVPGPGGAHWFKGNFTEVQETDSTRLQEEWVRKYGHVLKLQSILWVRFPF